MKIYRLISLVLSIVFIFVNPCAGEDDKGGHDMKLTSSEFKHNGYIPKKFTCQGENINPPLIIEDIPDGAKTLAVIMDDPDAPMGTWVHWLVYNIPLVYRIEEDSVPGEQAINNFGRKDYGGPCPPSGTHRYFFKIYALDTNVSLGTGARKKDLEKAIEGHVIGKAELIGLYKKE